jgi:hypothetical protein
MRNLFKTFLLAVLLLATAGTANAQNVSVGIRIGTPPPEHFYRVPPQPAPDYEWVEGYQYPEKGHYKWHDGYWTRPPYAGAYWVEPYHVNGQYFEGHWEGSRGALRHDHQWDRGNQRDERREPRRDDHDRDHDNDRR